MNYEQLEDELSGLLQGNFFDCKPLPDTQSGMVPAVTKPVVYVMYDTSDFVDPENINLVIQKEKLKIGFEIHSRTRRGEQGIFAIYRIITKTLLGYKRPGCDKLQLVTFTPLQGKGPNDWTYYLQFSTTARIVEDFTEINGPELKQVNF